jgi:hypothetical protein
MAYCPKCTYEYKDGISICPDCDEILVPTLPRTQGIARPVDDSWQAVCSVDSGLKTEMAKGALDSGNIPSTVISRTFTAFGGSPDPRSTLNDLLGQGNLILVPKEYVDDARLILHGILGDDDDWVRYEK